MSPEFVVQRLVNTGTKEVALGHGAGTVILGGEVVAVVEEARPGARTYAIAGCSLPETAERIVP